MFYSASLLIEALLTGVFLYCVLFLPPNVFTNVSASTALALAVLCCINGINDLCHGVKEKYDVVTNRFGSSRRQPLNKRSLPAESEQPVAESYLAMLGRSLAEAVQCVLGYAGVITLLTVGPLRLFPYAHKMSFWPISMAVRDALTASMTDAASWVSNSMGRGSAIKNLSNASQDYLKANMPVLMTIMASLSESLGPIASKPQAYISEYRSIVRPIWRDQDFRTVWLIVWTACAVGVILLHRMLIQKRSFSHLLALLSGALVAGFLNESTILRDIQNAEAAAYGTSNVLRLESIAYRLSLMDMSCNCVEQSLATLGVTTWVFIILTTMALPSIGSRTSNIKPDARLSIETVKQHDKFSERTGGKKLAPNTQRANKSRGTETENVLVWRN